MKDERLKKVINELRTIQILGEKKEEELYRLISCIATLKSVTSKYNKEANYVLDMIQKYISGSGCIYEIDCARVILIDVLTNEDSEDESILGFLKESYADAKDSISEAIPEEVKAKCNKIITTTGNIGRGFADTINKEIPQIPEGVERIKETHKKVKKEIKLKLREVLLSDDEE